MDVLTEDELRIKVAATPSHLPLFVAVLAFAVLTCVAASRHEAWADEAQSWLLGRDAGLVDLWTRLLHYEGTPGLWQTLLHCLSKAGTPYWGMNAFAVLLAVAAVSVFLWRAPFPLALRLALPFTFYLCYQYAIIARSYDLLPLLAFCAAAAYKTALQKPLLLTVLLCLMAAVSVHGMALAIAIGVSAVIGCFGKRHFTPYAVGFGAIVILLTSAAWPARDGTFVAGLNLSFDHLIEVIAKSFAAAFTGEWISSLLVVALSIPLLWRGGGWLLFALSSILLCGIASLVYAQVWHHGVLFLAWLFAIWISMDRQAIKNDSVSYKLALASLAIVAAVQCYWSFCSIVYDFGHPYSGSLAAARGLREMDLQTKKLYAIGYACIAIEPYFPRNIFANVNDGQPTAYWDWSRSNHVNRDSQHLAESRPGYVIVGYKNQFERELWTDLVRRSGYRAIRHFDGNSFWQTHVFEPEAYDLFERSARP